jgi:hypothetical protein
MRPVTTFRFALAAATCALLAAACAPTAPTTDADAAAATPWDWSDSTVLAAVNQVRAGRDLTPASWPGGARVAILLSFDVDNETVQGLLTAR